MAMKHRHTISDTCPWFFWRILGTVGIWMAIHIYGALTGVHIAARYTIGCLACGLWYGYIRGRQKQDHPDT